VYCTTGFTKDEIVDLCAMIRSAELEPGINHWPPILGLFKSTVVALTYMRRNRAQAEIGESFGVSQSTISRAVTGLTPILGKLLAGCVPAGCLHAAPGCHPRMGAAMDLRGSLESPEIILTPTRPQTAVRNSGGLRCGRTDTYHAAWRVPPLGCLPTGSVAAIAPDTRPVRYR
jgi:Helix-turn-helix of DDE superfamily endonuclease